MEYSYLEDAMEPENRNLKEKCIFPSKSTFKGRRWDSWDKSDRESVIEKEENRLVMTHTDADGYVSAALLMDYFGKENLSVITVDYEDIEQTLEYINEHAENLNEFFVCDLNLDEVPQVIDEIESNVNVFKWFDHHEWEEKKETLSDMGVDITIDTEECGASIVLEYLEYNGYSPTPSARDTVKITKDHDLWEHELFNIRIGGEEKCISQIHSQLAFYADDDKFMENILDYGCFFMYYEEELLRGDKSKGFIAKRVKEHTRKINYIVKNHTTFKNINGYEVAFAYGRASPGGILETLKQNRDIDILVHAKPAYPPKLSFRSTDGFSECHKIADELGGGGHEQAAGCKPGINTELFEFLDYIHKRGSPLLKKAEEVVRDKTKNN
jgi:oligoribonuclease NrnB/cAMP/cGMP phosphodiesterase (DHH superfamily)